MTPEIILDVIILIYYAPALLIGIYVGLKHGFARSAGWFNVILLSLFRLVGSALGIAAMYNSTSGIIAASIIFSSMGTVSLLGALLGLVGRVNQTLKDRALLPRFARFVHLATIVAIVLSIVGGNYAFSSNADTRAEGHTLLRVSIILLVLIYVVATGASVHSFALRSELPAAERRLLHVSILSLPFVLVRLILAICSVFLYSSNVFSTVSTTNTAIIVRAVMGVLMEIIVVTLFLWAGCTVDRSTEREAKRAQKHSANGKYQGHYGLVADQEFHEEYRLNTVKGNYTNV